MSDKKSYQAWTISDEYWEAIKDEIPKKERDPGKKYKNAPGQGRKPMPARKALEGIYSMCYEPAASGKRCPVSTAAAVLCTEDSRNGRPPDSLKRSGGKVWSGTMSWRESVGSGKVWTAVW